MNLMENYLDSFLTEIASVVFKSFRLLPGTLTSLQVIEEVVSILDAVLYPLTIIAAWRKAGSTIIVTYHPCTGVITSGLFKTDRSTTLFLKMIVQL